MAVYETDETKRIMERVRKMLRLANDAGAAEGERDTAMRMAHSLLAKYNLDLAEVEAAKPDNKEGAAVEPRVNHIATFGGWTWARNICQSIGELFFCHYLYSTGRTDRQCKHYFIGRTSNAITAALVAEFVVNAVYREAAKRTRDGNENNAFLRSFAWGAANRIRERVRAMKTDSRQIAESASTPGTSLVLASLYDTEKRANEQFVAVLYPKLGKGRVGKYADHHAAYASGRAYGSTVSLNPHLK